MIKLIFLFLKQQTKRNDSDLISKENAYGSPTIEQAQRDISFVFNDQTTDLPQNSDDSETKDAPVLESNEKESDNKMSETEESNKLDEKEINDTANTKQHENDQPKETTEETDIGSISDGNQSVLEKPVQEVQKEQEEKIVEKEEEEKAVKKEEGEKIVEREELINGQLPKEETSAEKVCDNDKTALSKDGKEDASHKENTFTRVNNMVAENPTEHHAHKENGHEVKRDRSNELRDDAVKPSCSRLRQPAMRRGNSLIHSERELTRNGSAKLPKGITRIARLNASPVKKVVKKLVKKEPEEKPKKKKMAPDFISRLTAPTVASKSKKAAGIPKKVDMSKKRPKAIVVSCFHHSMLLC
jgi:hypothetical protein